MVTGDNRIKFNKWYKIFLDENFDGSCGLYDHLYENFDSLPFAMQKGVFEAYYKTLRISISSFEDEKGWIVNVIMDGYITALGFGKGLDDFGAFKYGFGKLNEIVNAYSQ